MKVTRSNEASNYQLVVTRVDYPGWEHPPGIHFSWPGTRGLQGVPRNWNWILGEGVAPTELKATIDPLEFKFLIAVLKCMQGLVPTVLSEINLKL